MPVDPQVRELLDQLAAAGFPALETLTVQQARAQIEQRSGRLERQPVEATSDFEIPGPGGRIPVRLYRPTPGRLPLLVTFHGGGWVTGSIETHDSMCRVLANGVRCLVISVGYRRAPEHRFPAAVEDGYAATAWVAEHAAEFEGDATRIAVSGDSAGGNLAAAVALIARERGHPPLSFQLLSSPVLDREFDLPSWKENGEGYALTRHTMRWFWDHYLGPDGHDAQPYAAPLRAPDLRGLPPALIVTAEFDPLRDQQLEYAQTLQQAGVRATVFFGQGMIHGFTTFSMLDRGREALQVAIEALREALGT